MSHLHPQCCCDDDETECPLHGDVPPVVTCSRSGNTVTFSIIGADTARILNPGVNTPDLTPLLDEDGDYSGSFTTGQFDSPCITATNGCGTRTCCAGPCNCPPHLPNFPPPVECEAYTADFVSGGTMPGLEVTITGGATALYFDPMQEPPVVEVACCPFEGTYLVPCGPKSTSTGQFFGTIRGGTTLPDVYRACFVRLGDGFFVPGQGLHYTWGWQVLTISHGMYQPPDALSLFEAGPFISRVDIDGGILTAPAASFSPTSGTMYDDTNVPTVLMGWLPSDAGGNPVYYTSGWLWSWFGLSWKRYEKQPTSNCRSECNFRPTRPAQASRYTAGEGSGGGTPFVGNGLAPGPGGCRWFDSSADQPWESEIEVNAELYN